MPQSPDPLSTIPDCADPILTADELQAVREAAASDMAHESALATALLKVLRRVTYLERLQFPS